MFWLDGASISAHVMAWLLHTGLRPIKFVLHKCDNGLCVRFSHLYAGTQRENINDKVARNRQAFGEKHGRHKLTEQQVRDIWTALANGALQRQVAVLFNVSQSTVTNVKLHKSWKTVKEQK